MLGNIINIVGAVGTIINMLIPILIGAAIVVFFWGLVLYIRSSGKGHDQGRNIMIAGLASLFIMVTLYGLINFFASSLGINTNGTGNASTPNAPAIPRQVP